MLNIFKRVFRSPDTMSVDGIEVWSVRWTAVRGEFSGDKRDVAEFFTNEHDALAFKEALADAFVLTRNSISNVKVTKERR